MLQALPQELLRPPVRQGHAGPHRASRLSHWILVKSVGRGGFPWPRTRRHLARDWPGHRREGVLDRENWRTPRPGARAGSGR
jgi:hypothetical protein